MAVKAVNNTAGLNRLISTLLVYRVYLKINKLNFFTLSITDWAAVIQKVMAEIVKLYTK